MPSSISSIFSDPLPYQAALRISDVEVLPTAKGKFRAELTQIDLHELWMQRGRENLPHVVVGTVKPTRKAISFLTNEQADMVYCGQSALPGSIIVQRTDAQHRRNGANRHWGSMSLAQDDFQAACRAITGRDFSDRAFRMVVQPGPELMSRLLKVHEQVGVLAEKDFRPSCPA